MLGLQDKTTYIYNMKKKNTQLIKALQSHLLTVNKLWDEKQQSPAYIVGYLEAVVKQTIEELKD